MTSPYALIDQRVDALAERLVGYQPAADVNMLQRAYEFARTRHEGQERKSGEPYIGHPVEVAHLTAAMGLDIDCLCAALLHDTVEDTGTTSEEIQQHFGPVVRFLVESLTKIAKLRFESREHAQAENIRKLVISMSQDIRVVLIKLADRLHNMQTLEHMSEAGRERIARETLEIYAPIAHRLGIHWVKSQLEDMAFRWLEPEAYRALADRLAVRRDEREAYVDRVLQRVEHVMRENDVPCEVQGRPKHLYSIHRKMVDSRTEFENIYDLTAFRVIVDSRARCYDAVGVLHDVWKPVPGRFKDYIAQPKANGYRSLHTVVMGLENQRIEFQIRTQEMHQVAEFGVAAHVGYKEGRNASQMEQTQITWLRALTREASSTQDSQTFLDQCRTDLLADEIQVLSPKGRVVSLPRGSTPVDFAFGIHSEVGQHCTHAIVNGRNVPLRHELKNGDVVEIKTRADQRPRAEWLEFARSSRARQKIRSYIASQRRDASILEGRALLSAELQKHSMRLDNVIRSGGLRNVAEQLKLPTAEHLLISVGTDRIKATTVVQRLLPQTAQAPRSAAAEAVRRYGEKLAHLLGRTAPKESVKVAGVDGEIETSYARCCNPVPGDPIVGYITRQRVLVVHTEDCPMRARLNEFRFIDVAWDSIETPRANEPIQRRVTVRVVCKDQPGMLAEMSRAFTSRGVNITNAHCRTRENGVAHNLFEIVVSNTGQLQEALREVKRVRGVLHADRVQTAQR